MQQPRMSSQGLQPSSASSAMNEFGEVRECHIAAERPLTLYLDKRELVTLMTLGSQPELLTLGYLRNQGLIRDLGRIRAVQVDWDVASAVVSTRSGGGDGADQLEQRLSRRTVTTGCGQGTVFGDMMGELDQLRLPQATITQSVLYRLLGQLSNYNEVYRRAGAVHGCALCDRNGILVFVEDVGRHNAVDAIAGHMWLENTEGTDKIFYTTGRLTSEMVIKVAQMGIPVLLSRSGITQMGLDIARQVGVTLIARAKGRHFLVFNGAENMVFDAAPVRPAGAAQQTDRDSRAS